MASGPSCQPLDSADAQRPCSAWPKYTPRLAGTHDGQWAKVVTPRRVEPWEEGHPDSCEEVRE